MPAKHQTKPYDIEVISKNYSNGATFETLSEQTGLSIGTISRILKRHKIPTRRRKFQIDESVFNSIDSEWKAYFLGLAFADGNVRPIEKGYSFKINLHEKDKEVLDALCCKIYGDASSLKYKPAKTYIGKDKKVRNNSAQWMLSIHNKRIVTKLIEYGCVPNKSLVLDWPSKLPSGLYGHFLRGYLDGDGWVQNQEVGFISSLKFCQRLQEFLFNVLKMESHLSPALKVARVKVHKKNDIAALYNLMYKDATIFLKRKREKFLEIMT